MDAWRESFRLTSRNGSARGVVPARSLPSARLRDPVGGVGAAAGPPQRPTRPRARRPEPAELVSRPRDRVPNPTGATNLEPLLINTAGSWADRPEARTRIANLFLASDFVRTHTDLATMEGANEAARRAVNAILAVSGSRAPACSVWKPREPAIFGPARALDRVRWRLFRRSVKPPLRVAPDGSVEPRGPVAAAMTAVARRAARR